MLDQAENQYKNFHFHTHLWHPKKAYTISTKPSSIAREKHKNKLTSQFQLNKKPVIFEAVRVEEDTSVIFEVVRVREDTLCEKLCQTYFLKK